MRETTLSILLGLIIIVLCGVLCWANSPQEVDVWDFPTVMDSQRHLKMMGYYKGEIDGKPGVLTDTAHKAYSNDKCGVLDYRKWVRK